MQRGCLQEHTQGSRTDAPGGVALPLPAPLTYGRAVEKECHAEEHAHTQRQDEGAPAAPAQCAAVARRTDEWGEDETKDGAQEPGKAVVLLWEACGDTGRGQA